jgi:hypothetical protein
MTMQQQVRHDSINKILLDPSAFGVRMTEKQAIILPKPLQWYGRRGQSTFPNERNALGFHDHSHDAQQHHLHQAKPKTLQRPNESREHSHRSEPVAK